MAIYTDYEQDSAETLQLAYAEYGEDLRLLSSFGADSALTIRLANVARIPLRVLGINTGFWFRETLTHQRQLESSEGFFTTKYGIGDDLVADITERELWKTDLPEYNRLTKAEPLSLAISELGVRALITGVRRTQTANRAGLNTQGLGQDGEARINAVLDWPDKAVDAYFKDKGLLRHPLYYKGYGSIGDWTLTRPGQGRSGRNLGATAECGLNVEPAFSATPILPQRQLVAALAGV